MAALQVQSQLLHKFVQLARSSAKEVRPGRPPTKDKILTTLLRRTLAIAANLTGAEKGSLFLLDDDNAVTDSILTRGDEDENQHANIIGKVFDRGLVGWVRHHARVGLVTDTQTDDRWLDLDDQPYAVRSALAVPIMSGEKLTAILTLLHPRAGHFTWEAADLMLLTARQIGSALENARLYARLNASYDLLERANRRIESYSKALDAEIEKARVIQRQFLPRRLPQVPGWELAACFHPARQVSGDFYDAFLLPAGQLALVIADVCDKGVGSALYMVLFRSLIRIFSGKISLPDITLPCSIEMAAEPRGDLLVCALQAVSLTNDYMAEEHGREGMFASLFLGVLDPRSGRLAYVNAGHEPLFIVGPEGIRERLNARNPVVGMLPGTAFEVQQARLARGETLIGYTDGVTDALSPAGEMFTRQRLMEIIAAPSASASSLIARIESRLFSHMGDTPVFDDITMICARRR